VIRGHLVVLDWHGFHVDVDAVEEAAKGIGRSVHDEDNVELRGLCGDAAQYGHAGLHDALMQFCIHWSDGLDTLTRDAGTIGDTLSKVAQLYRRTDTAAARSLGSDPPVEAAGG
jgi:hypothetical protein